MKESCREPRASDQSEALNLKMAFRSVAVLIGAWCLSVSHAHKRRHVPKITVANGGILVDGQPFSPNGYTNHAHLRGPANNGSRSYESEVVEGFNAVFTYRGLPGEGEGRFGNESWPDTEAFLDRCAAIGIKVLFDFSQNVMLDEHLAPPLDAIRDAVSRFKDHPAILSWYLIDEPDGRKYPPRWVAAASSLIRSLDTSHPISMCFDTTNRPDGTWPLYVNATDVVLADIYSISGSSKPCTAANGCNITRDVGDSIRATIAATKKTLWYVRQAYGSQEGYQREPSTGEVRAMVYSSIIAGATGIFYFTREDADWTPPVVKNYLHVGTAQPRSSVMWSEARRLALEVSEMAPWLMSGLPRPMARASVTDVDVGAFQRSDGTVVLVAMNMLGVPVPSVTVELATSMWSSHAAPPQQARVLFASAYRIVQLRTTANGVTLTDTLDALSSRVYLIEPIVTPPPSVTKDPTAANLIFNGDLEWATSVGVPDGWMAQWGGDGAATQLHDSCVFAPSGSRGTHSLRLTTPAAGSGMRAWSYPVKADLLVGSDYSLTFWARGGEAQQTLAIGFEALFGAEDVPCPGGSRGQCSYTPQPVTLELNKWVKFEKRAKARFQPDHTGYYGAAGMVSFELVSVGVAWIDEVVLRFDAEQE